MAARPLDPRRTGPLSSEGRMLDRPNESDTGEKRVRTRSGCLNCRRKRRKCDELRPRCANCYRRDEMCEWGVRLSFRSENAQSIPDDHPSMQKDVSSKRRRRFEIMNVTPEVIRDYWHDMKMTHDSLSGGEGSSTSRVGLAEEPDVSILVGDHQAASTSSPAGATTMPIPSNDASYPLEGDMQGHHETHLETQDTGFGTRASYHTPGVGPTMFAPPSIPDYEGSSNEILPIPQLTAEFAAAHLLALRETHSELPVMVDGSQQIPSTHAMRPNSTRGVPMLTPNFGEEMLDDGIFLPGSTYQELHTTLRTHIFNTARSNAATGYGTPEYGPGRESSAEQNNNHGLNFTATATFDRHESDHGEAMSHRAPELTQHQEYELWKNYTDELAPWLDKFDNQCHFGHKLPPLAKSHAHLRYSILALSARQLERKDHSRPSASLALYQEAIHQLLPELQTRNTAVIASCVVLCVLEMMSCAPKEWRRHLDGCASLMESVGINGFVGGIEQALFWCFARMDVCGGLISSDRTLIPIGNWASKLSLADDVRLFREASSFDTYANYAVFLCGQVLDLFASYAAADKEIHATSYAKRWSELFEYIEDWYLNRPEEMRSILHGQADKEDHSRPFPILLFGNAPAVSGNQLYHTAALLMLQKRPRGVTCRRSPRSILWHARRICAISISNTHHGCWTNCVQPLWLAGQVMSHPAEHRAILDTYELIERETGWGAKWRAEDLRKFWGELDSE